MSKTDTRRSWDDEELAFEAWKHCSAVGGADKNWMIQIVTWLLGLSAVIIGFQATGDLEDPCVAAMFGILVSLVAAYVALLYGAYAAWNWALADEIAEAYHWQQLLPDHEPVHISNAGWQGRLVRCLARPCKGEVARVFKMFVSFSVISAAIHFFLLWQAV